MSVELKFANDCMFTRSADGTMVISWENGHALEAVRGAAVDYINPLFHMACSFEDNQPIYEPSKDLGRLILGGINPRLALIVVGFRKVAGSIGGAQLNIAELFHIQKDTPDGVMPKADWELLVKHNQAYNAVLDIAATVLGMNGISLMLKGHNYIDSDSMWARLESAVDLDSNIASLGITDYLGVLLHDALHPYTADWKVTLASKIDSPLIGHVNGVLVKRMPGIPAGTTIAFVTRAAMEEIVLIRPSAGVAFKGLADSLDDLIIKIRAHPLDWCAMFQRAGTAENLKYVDRMAPLAAFVYGACTKLFDRKMSIMKSASFKNNASRYPAMVATGSEWAEMIEPVQLTHASIKKMMKPIENFLDGVDDTENEE